MEKLEDAEFVANENKILDALCARAAKEKLDEGSPLPVDRDFIKRFLIAKKTEEKTWSTLTGYVKLLKHLNWATEWDSIKDLISSEFLAQVYPYN
eukprot:TRINITY_DN364_c0_g1_i1.p2 TRINITY_DN364_c0_g1~~TRINITY_DN364_c0_g1_i1.p2  ORF type:complete len:108 (-),score=29.99 TRINITY_DN364_c0_g1_i1:850-1134(-)